MLTHNRADKVLVQCVMRLVRLVRLYQLWYSSHIHEHALGLDGVQAANVSMLGVHG